METPEYIFHRPCAVFAPDDKTRGDASRQTGAKPPQQQEPAPENPQIPANYTEVENYTDSEREFCWWRDLSSNAQQLYLVLIGEGGDKDNLPGIAIEEGWDLDGALDELRAWEFLEESDPIRYRLK